MPSYSTKNVHVFLLDGVDDQFSDLFKPLPDRDFGKVRLATEEVITRGMKKHMTMIVTCCGDVYINQEDLNSLVDFIKTHSDVKTLVTKMPDCIVFITKAGFVVTIRLFGTNKLAGTEDEDDSFEVDEDLTQKVGALNPAVNPFLP